MGVKRRILCVKRILLSFPQFVSIGILILHEVQQCTRIFFHQFDQHPQMLRKNTFFTSNGNESKICFTHTILPPGVLTKKHAKMGTLLISFFFNLFSQKVHNTGELKKETIPNQFCTQMRSLPKLRVE
jgi:hypothetical protein